MARPFAASGKICALGVALVALLVVASTFPGAASADGFWMDSDAHWYAGAGGGYSHNDGQKWQFNQNPRSCGDVVVAPSVVCKLKSGDASFRFFTGYQFSRHVGVEAQYAILRNTYDARGALSIFSPSTIFTLGQDTRALTLSGTLTVPVTDDFSLTGALGVNHWESRIERKTFPGGTGAIPPFERARKERGLSMTFGARLNYDLTEQFRVRAAWDYYHDVGGSAVARFANGAVETLNVDVNMFSLDLVYRFR